MNLKNMKPNKLTIEIEDGIINSIFESDLTTIIFAVSVANHREITIHFTKHFL